MSDTYYWCPRCRALIHSNEVTLDRTHVVTAAVTAGGAAVDLVHEGLRPEND